MVNLVNVTKMYGEKIANKNINLSIKIGEIYGILGPNGAGKTTLIRQIMGFTNINTGLIKINNLNPWTDSKEILKFTGYVAGEIKLFDSLTGMQFIKLFASFRNNIEWNFVEKLIKIFDFETNTKIKKMSKGTKQKLAIIVAVMHKPKFLVLDEPTSGLDPVMQSRFAKLIFELKNEIQTTVVICSHIFAEVAKLCDRICFIKNGELIEECFIDKNKIETIEKKFESIYESENFF